MFRFAQHDNAIVWTDLAGEFASSQAAKCFEVFRGSFLDHILRQARGWRTLIPVECLQIIAHELFIETRWALSDGVLIFGPETRGVRCQTFVNQEQVSIDCAEFKFCICDDDAALLSMIPPARINFQAERFHALG